MTFALLGLALALVLWLAGLFAVLPPAAMGLVLGVCLVCGLHALLPPRRTAVAAAGLAALTAAALYLAVLFWIDERAVPIERRVTAPENRVRRLRLVDLNVLHGYPRFEKQERRYRNLVAALRELEPTVIVLQEAWSVVGHGRLATRLGDELGYDVAYARANGSRRLLGFEEGSAVLSRLPIVSAQRLVLSPRRPLWEARIALVVQVRIGDGRTVTVVGAHLTHRGRSSLLDHQRLPLAARQARNLAARLAPHELALVAGDFNSPSGGPAVAAFEERGLVDVVRGGVDHVLVKEDGSWQIERADWALRPDLADEPPVISDHPAIVVDLVDREKASPWL